MSETKVKRVLAVGAHPDDIEFGAGGVLLKEARAGTEIMMLVCSSGESGSKGKAETREAEARAAAALLGAAIQFIECGGDAQMYRSPEHSAAIARVIREFRPQVVLAPSLVENQHPDHAVIGASVRDACRVARYGGIDSLKSLEAHAIESLLFYSIIPGSEPLGQMAFLVDVSSEEERWRALMECHASQMANRRYSEIQFARARTLGLSIGCDLAQAVYSNDNLVVDRLADIPKGSRLF